MYQPFANVYCGQRTYSIICVDWCQHLKNIFYPVDNNKRICYNATVWTTAHKKRYPYILEKRSELIMARNVQPSRLGAVIAAKRKMMGLSQRQLADQIGLNNATISKLEKDPSLEPDIRTIRLLAEALGLDYNYLLSLNETIDDDPDMRIIARAKGNMSPEQQKEMMSMLRTAFDVAFANAESDGIDEADVF